MNCAVSHGLRTRRALWLRTQRIPHGMLAQPIACPFPPSSHPVIQGPVSQGVREVRGSSTWKEDNSHLFQRRTPCCYLLDVSSAKKAVVCQDQGHRTSGVSEVSGGERLQLYAGVVGAKKAKKL